MKTRKRLKFQNKISKEIHSIDALTTISPIDGRYWPKTEPLSRYFSEGALFRARIEVEANYLVALSEMRNVDGTKANFVRDLQPEEREYSLHLGESLTRPQLERIKEIESSTRHDVKATERALREMLRGTSLTDVMESEAVHFGLTSEDVNNLAYRLLLDRARRDVMIPVASLVVDILCQIASKHKATPMMARTHGQNAVPTTLGKEMANYAVRIQEEIAKLQKVQLRGKCNGAVGNYNAQAIAMPEINWIDFSEKFVRSLGFEPNDFTTQINPFDDIIELLQGVERINGAILDLDLDMWRYISDGWFVQQVRKGEVGSSTMPQKVNPIDFENSEGNLGLGIGILETMSRLLYTSRLQRDLSNSTVSRNFGLAFAHSLVGYVSTIEGLQRVRPDTEKIRYALNADYAILTEAVQTILRRIGIEDPYSIVASLSRGQTISQDEWRKWVKALPVSIDERVRSTLFDLTPETYLGNAIELTDKALTYISSLRS